MRTYFRVSIVASAILALALTACGGGGGGDNGACSAVKSSTGKVAGGEQCGNSEPGVVLVESYDKDGNWIERCTGSYVSLTSVLTAAHCFKIKPNAIGIYSPESTRYGTLYYVDPLYNGAVNSPFDLAVVRVNAPVDSAPLPVLWSVQPTMGDDVVAYGYGFDENGMDALARVKNGEAPLKATYTTYAGYYSGTMAVYSTGEGSTCPGDSGGPVLAKNGGGEYGIIGITRSGPDGCGAEKGRPALLASVQSKGAVEFLKNAVPDIRQN